jgi:hypothetical protein
VKRRAEVRLRPRVGGHNTSASGSRADNRRRRGGRSPRSGLWRAGSGSRPSMRSSRRTGTSTARPIVAHVPDTGDTRRPTARRRGARLCARTGAHLRCDRGGAARVAFVVLSVWDRARVVVSSELPARVGRNDQHVQRSSAPMMSDTVARPRDGLRAVPRPAKIDRAGVTPRQY